MAQTILDLKGKVHGIAGGAARKLSAGFAGVGEEEARAVWAEEQRHAVSGPGAYEWWYFQALSPTGDGFVLTLFEGLPFHPRYLTQTNRYTNRLASFWKGPWPSLQPSRYPAAYMAVYEGGKRVAQFLNLYPPDSVRSVPGVPDICVGPNRITLRQDGSFGIVVKGYPYEVKGGRPRKETGRLLSAQLTYTPTFSGVQHSRPFRAPDVSGAAHHWVLAAPHGRMVGEIHVTDEAAEELPLAMSVDTLGYHDHVYGEGGLSTGVNTLLWGFLQGDNWTAAWHQTLGRDGLPRGQVAGRAGHGATRGHADGLIFFEQGHEPLVIDSPEVKLSKSRRSAWLLKHPGKIVMHGSDAHGHALELVLAHPSVMDTAPFHTRLMAQGTVSIPGRGGGAAFAGRGTTHVLKLRRLRWPILSDLTLMAIMPVARDDPIWNA